MQPDGLIETIMQIRAQHRARRFAMKQQFKLDRSLESYVRINFTDWEPGGDKKSRDKANAKVAELIKEARTTTVDPDNGLQRAILANDTARRQFDVERKRAEKQMEALAKTLPVYQFVEKISGFGALGLATIVAECASNNAPMSVGSYRHFYKVWKRLGYSPYEGLAGSTWKRPTWRPRALTSEEWIANPFSGERYSLIQQIGESLLKHQTISKLKTASGKTEPKGPYGAIYCNRREHTATVHPDWSDMHAKRDAERIVVKNLLRDLWRAWRDTAGAEPVRVLEAA